MPQIVLEVTPKLAALLDFDALLHALHQGFDERGYARASAIRSRVFQTLCALAGSDANTQFVVATMTTTVPRTADMEAAMAQFIHDTICDAIKASGYTERWQCGVFRSFVEPELYIRTDSHPDKKP
jgi:5-carboxymethyl-2-hydroxymuconate isomerase